MSHLLGFLQNVCASSIALGTIITTLVECKKIKINLLFVQMHVLGNADPTENVAVRYQFTCGGDDIEIHRARQVIHRPRSIISESTSHHLGIDRTLFFLHAQIVIPFRGPRSWCAYAWDMKFQKTHIIDPMAAMSSEDRTLEAHNPTIERLHAALANCIEFFFDGWSPEWSNRSTSVVNNVNLTASM
jgi:hypothetical protein